MMKVGIILLAVLVSATVVLGTGNGQCSNPPHIRHGYIKSGRKDMYNIGNFVVFRCKGGYKLLGSSHIKCLRSGNSAQWNNQVPACKKVHDQPVPQGIC